MPQSGLRRKMARTDGAGFGCVKPWRNFETDLRATRPSDPPRRLRRLENRADNPVMGPAAAQIAGKSQPDLGLARLRDAVEQRLGKHDNAGDAVAALRRLLRDESGLQRGRPLERTEALDGGDLR